MAALTWVSSCPTDTGKQRTPLTMIIPPAVLVAVAAVISFVTPLGQAVEAAAIRFEDQAGYNATVLVGAHITHPVAIAAAESTGITVASVLAGVGSAAGALILAFLALYWRRLPVLRRARLRPAGGAGWRSKPPWGSVGGGAGWRNERASA